MLTKEMIEAGAVLLKRLDETEVRPDAAFLFFFSDEQQWKLVFVEKELGEKGPFFYYRRIRETYGQHHVDLVNISMEDITLAKPDTPIVKLLSLAIKTGPGISGIRFTNNAVNGVFIEDAYIYRL